MFVKIHLSIMHTPYMLLTIININLVHTYSICTKSVMFICHSILTCMKEERKREREREMESIPCMQPNQRLCMHGDGRGYSPLFLSQTDEG